MTSRASIWDGTGWVSMTGGIEDSGGGTDPDDSYLRLDGANNPIAPSNFLRQLDGDARYLGLAANAVSASVWASGRALTLTGDVSGVVWWDGGANVSMGTTVANDSHTHGTQYLSLAGGVLAGRLFLGATTYTPWSPQTVYAGVGVYGTQGNNFNYMTYNWTRTAAGYQLIGVGGATSASSISLGTDIRLQVEASWGAGAEPATVLTLTPTNATFAQNLVISDGAQVTGSGPLGWGGAIVRNIMRGNTVPTAGEGAHGDLYVQYA